MTATVYQFASKLPTPATPSVAVLEASGEPGAPMHGNCAAPLPFLHGARLVEFIGKRPGIRVAMPDGSAYVNRGWGWAFHARDYRVVAVTIAATCEQLSAWVLEQRRNASKANHPCNTNRITYHNTKGKS